MKTLAAVIVFVFLIGTAVADELVLTDGAVIPWISLRDLGDSYEVETPSKGKLSVSKDRVAKFVKKIPTDEKHLTGATFSLDNKKDKLETTDLLKLFEPKNSIQGKWSCDGDRLVSPIMPHARILFPVEPSMEYDLSTTVQMESGGSALYFFLPAMGGRVWIRIDATEDGRIRSGVADIPETTFTEKLFKDDKPHRISIHVRKSRLVMAFDGKKFIDWANADFSSSPPPKELDPKTGGIVVGAYATRYAFTALTVMQRSR